MLLVGIDWAERHHVAASRYRERSALRAFYPAALAAFGGDPGGRDAVAVLQLAPTPELGRALPHAELVAALCCAGRGARSRPVPPPSRQPWPANSWRPHRWWPLPSAKWWRLPSPA